MCSHRTSNLSVSFIGSLVRDRHGQFFAFFLCRSFYHLCDDAVELCAQDCGRFGESPSIFFIVLCDDIVRELFVRSGRDEVSRIE